MQPWRRRERGGAIARVMAIKRLGQKRRSGDRRDPGDADEDVAAVRQGFVTGDEGRDTS